VAIDSAAIELGGTSGPVASYVDPDEVAAFALAINDGRSSYLDGSAVPPTYPVIAALPVVLGLPPFPLAVLAAARANVHAEQDMVLHKPIRPGNWLHTSAERVGAAPTKAGMIVEQRVRSVDDDGDLVVTQRWVTMLIGEAIGPPRGQAPPDRSYAVPPTAELVAKETVRTTRDQTFRYAGAAGDRSPMHVNDESARERGFPRKFNQGLCTLGLITRGLIDAAADGDPTRVARLAVRFSAPAFPGDDIELAIYEIGPTQEGLSAYAFEAESAGRTVLRHGRLEVR
jgi:acyl dehydratase